MNFEYWMLCLVFEILCLVFLSVYLVIGTACREHWLDELVLGLVFLVFGILYCKTLPVHLPEADCSIFTLSVVVTFCHH